MHKNNNNNNKLEREWLTSTAFLEDHILAKVPEA